MSSPDNTTQPAPSAGWRFKCGIGLFILAFALALIQTAFRSRRSLSGLINRS